MAIIPKNKIPWKRYGVDIRPWHKADTLKELCKGGSSGYGWSHTGNMSACPELYRLGEILKLEFAPYESETKLHALPFGILWHWLLEAKNNKKNPLPALKKLPDVPLEEMDRLETMYRLYRLRYAKEPFEVLATELRIEVPVDNVWKMENGRLLKKQRQPYSVRYDAIIRYPRSGSVWSLEHKSASNIRGTTNVEWFTNSSIHGQVWVWNKHPISKVLGPLAGVLMDITTKEKETDFGRVPLNISREQLNMHERNLGHWLGYRNYLIETLGTDTIWPQNNKNCWSRYGPCQFVDHCHHGAVARIRIKPNALGVVQAA